MAFPRITAVIFVILLTGSLSLLCIGALSLNKPAGRNVEYVDGKIEVIAANMDFVLETADGQHLQFHCGSSCHTALRHLLRHLHEHATTVVYYVTGSDGSLIALNVD